MNGEPSPSGAVESSRELPSGVVSFLMTDIEGSTRLLRALGEGYGALLDHHHALLRAAWRAHDGHELATEGDGFLVVFEDASDAIAAAATAQRAIAAATWPTGMPVRVRIGIHTGYARPRGDDYAALALHRAARVVDAAHGGQVLVTGDAAARATGLPSPLRLERLGRFRVRDFDEPPELFRLTAPGAEQRETPPRVRPAEGHNLVRPLTSFLGRNAERAALARLVATASVTTVVGSAGAGKTRLAIETALDIASAWDDGAWFVDLAPLSSGENVPDAISHALGAKAAPGSDPWGSVLDHLRDRRALVILDNCEHLAEVVSARAAELLDACPRVGLLATSRLPLGLRSERVYRLDPLPCDHADSPAVRLFHDRAVILHGIDDATVVQLCVELDGLPLAIELAAARTTAIRPGEILERLRSTPSVLRSRDPTLPERQRTLGRLLDWSYDLLGPQERAALRRLTVFAGSFDLETAQRVCATGEIATDDVPELVWALVDSSLIVPEVAEGVSRYRLLATVRAYAESRTSAEERADALCRLGNRYADVLGPPRATGLGWLSAMALELENVHEVVEGLPDDATAQALAWSVGRYHELTDTYRTGIQKLVPWMNRRSGIGPHRVALLTLLAALHMSVGELDQADKLVAEAADLSATTGPADWDPAGIAIARGYLALRRGDPVTAAREARTALPACRLERARAEVLSLLAIALGTLGDFKGAAAALEEGLAAACAAGMDTFLSVMYAILAEAHMRLGNEIAAATSQATSLEFARAFGRRGQLASAMMNAARLSATRQRVRDAVVLQAAADEVWADVSFTLFEDDAAIRDALMTSARNELGAVDFDRAVREGHALSAETAADMAASLLLAVSQEDVERLRRPG